jgi:hypothetical protein
MQPRRYDRNLVRGHGRIVAILGEPVGTSSEIIVWDFLQSVDGVGVVARNLAAYVLQMETQFLAG